MYVLRVYRGTSFSASIIYLKEEFCLQISNNNSVICCQMVSRTIFRDHYKQKEIYSKKEKVVESNSFYLIQLSMNDVIIQIAC